MYFSCCWAVLCRPYNTLLGMLFEAHNLRRLYNCTDLGTFFKAKKFWDRFVAVRYFFLAESCEYVAVMYFPEAINKISLSLLLGFPTLGFSLAFA
jgi:hypothetical protein